MSTFAERGPSPPASAIDGRAIVIAAVALLTTLAWCWLSEASLAVAVLSSLAAWALPIALYDIIVGRVYRRESAGLDPALLRTRPVDVSRLAIKAVGVLVTLTVSGAFCAGMGLLYPQLFGLFLQVIIPVVPILICATLFYVVIVDGMMKEPHDALFEVGAFSLFRWQGRDWSAIREYSLGWAIKCFFLPLMFGSLVGQTNNLLSTEATGGGAAFIPVVLWIVSVVLILDVTVGVCGYALTLRPLDTHIRSTNPSALGWLACLICYPPIHAVTMDVLLTYRDGLTWVDWSVAGWWLAIPWGLAVLLCQAGWIWAHLMFGLRFSNLTHRGIITNGAFRLTKHPSYVSKNIGWWLIHAPFLSVAGWETALLHTAGLLGVNLVYYLRAKTEERHLLEDPVYREYAAWIAEHGLLARLRRRTITALRWSTVPHQG